MCVSPAVLTKGPSLLRSSELNDNRVVTEYLAQAALDGAFVSTEEGEGEATPAPSADTAKVARGASAKPPLPSIPPVLATGDKESSFVARMRSRPGRNAASPSPPHRAGSASPHPPPAVEEEAPARKGSASSTPRPASAKSGGEDPYATIRQLVQTVEQLKVCTCVCVSVCLSLSHTQTHSWPGL